MRRLLCCALLLAAAAPDPVVAVRGTDQVTASQVRALVSAADPDLHHKLVSDPAALRSFVTDFLLQRAIMAETAAEKWDQRPEIAAALQHAHDQIIVQSFLRTQAAPPPAYPSEAEIQSAYDVNKQRFLVPRTYHIAQIFAAAPAGAALDDAKHKLADLRARIQRGRLAFEAAAKGVPGLQYADLGLVPESRMVDAVRTTVSGMLEGSVSEPLCTQGGCNLVKLVATRPAGPASLPEVRDSLIKALRQQRERDGERSYANGLLTKEPVKVDEIQLSRVTSP